jgi:hypothetical protein
LLDLVSLPRIGSHDEHQRTLHSGTSAVQSDISDFGLPN